MIKVRIVAEPDQVFQSLIEADERFEVELAPCSSESELPSVIGDAEVVVSRSSTPLTRSVIERCSTLRVIAQATSGSDNIDLDAAREHGITVLSTAGANANAVAEGVVGAMISLQRGLPRFSANMLEGRWDRDDCAQRSELTSCTIGIIGVGRVGSRVAEMLAFLDRTPLGYDPYIEPGDLQRRGVEPVETIGELLRRSSIVTLHVPLTEVTVGLMTRSRIELMTAPRILINTSRGEVVDPTLAREMLSDGTLDGAWIDVFPDEPADPADLTAWSGGNFLISPHAAGCSKQARKSASEQLYESLCVASGLF